MNAKALIGAAAGALIGAIIWAVIAYTTGYEIGWIAWIIGAIVGGAARAMGADDQPTAVMCAILALASIFVGKLLATEYMASHEVSKLVDAALNRTVYEEAKSDSEEFAKVKSEDEYPKFIQERGFRDEGAEGDVTSAEIERFKEFEVPRLKRFAENNPSFEEWRKEMSAELNTMINKEVPVFEAVINDLGAMDILFAVLGILSAYKIALGGEE